MSEFFIEPKHLKRLFLEHGEKVSFQKKQHLVWNKDKSSWVFFLSDGVVRAGFTVGSEPERIIGYFVRGAVFAQSGSFISEHDERLSYTAESPVQVYRMKHQHFLRELHASTPLMQEYLAATLRNQLYLIDRIVYQGEKGLRKKCIRWLLFMAKYYGIKNGRTCTIQIPLTQETIANFLHATRESVNGELRALIEEGYIAIEKKRIQLLKSSQMQKLLTQ